MLKLKSSSKKIMLHSLVFGNLLGEACMTTDKDKNPYKLHDVDSKVLIQ